LVVWVFWFIFISKKLAREVSVALDEGMALTATSAPGIIFFDQGFARGERVRGGFNLQIGAVQEGVGARSGPVGRKFFAIIGAGMNDAPWWPEKVTRF